MFRKEILQEFEALIQNDFEKITLFFNAQSPIHPGLHQVCTGYKIAGKGNADSYCSCSHGAGRRMSRGEAKRRFDLGERARQPQAWNAQG